MAGHKDMLSIEGIVQPASLDSICPCHRICIAAADGHVYEVEPSYVGLYLERFEGHRVIARAQPILNGRQRSVIRLSSLTVLDENRADPNSKTLGGVVPPNAGNHDFVLCALGVQEIDA